MNPTNLMEFKKEAYMWVKRFIKKPEEMKQVCQKYRAMIKEKWDIRKNSEGVLDWIVNLTHQFKVQPRCTEITHEVLTGAGYPKSFTFEELKQIFKEYSRQGIRIDKRGYRGYNKFDWIKAIKELGYKDTLEKELKFIHSEGLDKVM